MTSRRWVVLDDVDTNIVYGGTWFTVYDSSGSPGDNGPAYMGTLHGVNETDLAVATFEFDGSAVKAIGPGNRSNSPGAPGWDCRIDMESVGSRTTQNIENSLELCVWDAPDGSAGRHRLEVLAWAQGQAFWLDRIVYVPAPGADVGSPVVMLEIGDPAIAYGEGWLLLDDEAATMTQERGATVEIEFVGTRLTWVGYVPAEVPHGPASGAFSIDGRAPATFTLRGPPEGGDPSEAPPLYHQTFFQTPQLPFGPHKVVVEYHGDASLTPLTLSHIFIQDGNCTVPAPGEPSVFDTWTKPSPSSGSEPTSSSPAGQNASTTNGVPVGAIVGGALGGLFLLLLSILMVVFLRRRGSNSSTGNSSSRNVEQVGTSSWGRTSPSTQHPQPFDVAPYFSGNEHLIPGVRPLVSYHPPVKGGVVGSVSDGRATEGAGTPVPCGASGSQGSTTQAGSGSMGVGSTAWGSGVALVGDSGAGAPLREGRLEDDDDVPPTYSAT
ncbi:hypothetical protein CC1G_10570 [Coprinopsis cinerea okayama7|uniref:Uncharacterized protein n=1 Tax=Coprinopsis cinerea (strain Okayama-7 / 130 / ATCC MYA-4618 / FGSC 9003) TaxID=240176 RepID=A8NDY4_COPC7|nr:hypothetical protein CC1G_10570 [Coprinopsis cinerea okayama7\|eukprot:XP_001832894.2 hypothetical protein CC1G_10570 [Coprinopsis cinerea okayama7\